MATIVSAVHKSVTFLSSERQPLSLFYQPETLGVKFLVGGVAETGAHIALPGYCLL